MYVKKQIYKLDLYRVEKAKNIFKKKKSKAIFWFKYTKLILK